MYITRSEYINLYEEIDEKVFASLESEAARVMDVHTTGSDNVKKLRLFYPVNEYDVTAVIHCAAKLIHTMHIIHQTENSMTGSDAPGLHGRVSSVTSGNESISYESGSATVVDEAVKDMSARRKLYADIVCEYLRGVSDKNGVNLLFKGAYPRRYLC